jgi:hypothetical protein
MICWKGHSTLIFKIKLPTKPKPFPATDPKRANTVTRPPLQHSSARLPTRGIYKDYHTRYNTTATLRGWIQSLKMHPFFRPFQRA